jgi:tetratricopeptide (TPR) repeat protein
MSVAEQMRNLICILALLSHVPAGIAEERPDTGSEIPAFELKLPNLARAREHWQQTPFAQDIDNIIRGEAGALIAKKWFHSNSSLAELQAYFLDVAEVTISANAAERPPGAWSFRLELPEQSVERLMKLLTGEEELAVSKVRIGNWSIARATGAIECWIGSDNPLAPAAAKNMADVGEDLALSVDFRRLFETGHDAASRDIFTAIGLCQAEYRAGLSANGIDDKLVISGFPTLFGRIGADDLVGMPEHAMATMTFAFTGDGLRNLVERLTEVCEGADIADYYQRSCANDFGPLAILASELAGTVSVAAAPGAPFPHFACSLPASVGWDRLIDGICARYQVDSRLARSDAVLVVLPIPWPSMLWLRRATKRWFVATDSDLIAEMSAAKTSPGYLSGAVGSAGLLTIDLPASASCIEGFCALSEKTAKDRAQRESSVIARHLSHWLSGFQVPITATVEEGQQSLTISGHGALVTMALPLCAVVLGVMPVAESIQRERKTTAKFLLEQFYHGMLGHGSPDDLPQNLAQPYWVMHRLGDEPWLLYLQPGAPSVHDQPIALTNPRYLDSESLRMNREGVVDVITKANAERMWATALRLKQRGGRASAEDWRDDLRALHFAKYKGTVAANDKLNYRLHLPSEWRTLPKVEPWTDLWTRRDGVAAMGVIAEQLNMPTEDQTQWLIDYMLSAKREVDPDLTILWQGDCVVDGVPGKRYRIRSQIGAEEFIFDNVAVAHNGYYHQVHLWAVASKMNEKKVDLAMNDMLERFEFIDPKRQSEALAGMSVSVARSRRMPLVVDLSGLGWVTPEPFEQQYAMVELRFRKLNSGLYAFIISADLGGRKLDERTLAAGLLRFLGEDFASVEEGEKMDTPLGRAMTFRYTATADAATSDCLAYSVEAGGRGVLIVISQPSTDGKAEELAAAGDAFMKHISLAPPAKGDSYTSDRAADAYLAAGIGAYLVTSQRFAEAMTWLKTAIEKAPTDRDSVRLLLDCYCRSERWTDAREWLLSTSGRYSEDPSIGSYKAYIELEAGDDEAALATYRSIFAAGWKDMSDFASYLGILRRLGRKDEAEAELTAHADLAATPAGIRLRAQYFTEDDQGDKAVALLRAAVEKSRSDSAMAVALIDTELTLQRPSEALEDGLKALQRLPRVAMVWHLTGVAKYRLGRYREAADDFHRALEIDPVLQGSRNFLSAVDQMLGKGDSTLISTPIAAVASIEEIPVTKGEDAAGGSYLLKAAVMSWSVDDGFRRSDRLVVAVPDRAACEAFTTLRFDFDPAYEDFYVNRLIVRDSTGAIAAEGGRDEWYVLDEQGDVLPSTRKTVSLPVPSLRPGCTIDCLTTRRQIGAKDAPPFTRLWLAAGLPVHHSIVRMRAARDAVAVVTSGRLNAQWTDGMVEIEGHDLVASRWEACSPDTVSDLPVVWIGASGRSWESVSRAYIGELQPFFADQTAISKEAERITAGIADAQERITAIALFVQQTLTYNAVEFGRRGRIPQPAERTLQRCSGDCKDHALLTKQLLAAAGINAHLALVPRTADVIDEMPDLDQFNHMVTVVTGADGVRILDCTAKNLDPRIVPLSEIETPMLLLDPERPRMFKSGSGAESRIAIERTVFIDERGALSIQESATLSGYFADEWRTALLGKSAEQRCQSLKNTFGAAVATVTLVEATALDDPREPLRVQLAYVLRNRLHGSEGPLTGRIPDLWGAYQWAWTVQRGIARRRPLAIKYPMTMSVNTSCRVPEGMSLRLRTPVAQDDDGFLSFSEQIEPAQQPSYRHEVTQHAGLYPAADYLRWCDRVDAILDRMAVEVTVADVSKQK